MHRGVLVKLSGFLSSALDDGELSASRLGFTVGECDSVALCLRNMWGPPSSVLRTLLLFVF
jgi:hypothetical protein